MAIKLYKSQLTPTTQSSNVENKAFVSMAEAGSIGKAWKGMVRSGELLYAKHQDIKTDNEVAEKKKEVANGTDNYTGLSEVTKTASTYNDPDSAGKYYNDQWQNIFDNVNGTLSGKQAQRKFKSWMTSQNISDINSIKSITTGNMIAHDREMKLDNIETIKKRIVFPQGEIDYNAAIAESKEALFGKKAQDTFGSELKGVQDNFYKEVAFFTYKNVPLAGRAEALEKAKKDDRLDVDDVQKLISHFKTSGETSTKLINSEMTKMDNMADDGILPELSVLDSYEATGEALDKPELVLKAQKIKAKVALVQSLNLLSTTQIENFITETNAEIAKDTDGTSTVLYDQLKTIENYHAKLVTDLKNDPIRAVSKRGTYEIDTIDFREFRININDKEYRDNFKEGMIKRKSQAESIGAVYGVEAKYLSEVEATQITSELQNMDNAEQIKFLSQTLVEGFGDKSPDVFAQLQEKDAFLAHIGGLSIVSNASGFKENKAIDLAIEGYLLNKQPNIDIKVKDTDIQRIKAKYNTVFPENTETFNNIIGTANNIYSALYYKSSKYKTGVFDSKMYEQAVEMSMGKNKNNGGVGEYKNHKVHVPMWLENDEFNDFVDWLKEDEKMLFKASGSTVDGEFLSGKPQGKYNGKMRDIEIFKGDYPHLISVGYGRYKVAMQDHPTDRNPEPRYVEDGNFTKKGSNFFIIDFNKVRTDWKNRLVTPSTKITPKGS